MSVLYVDVRKGMVLVEGDQLLLCLDRDLRTPGNLPSKLTLKVKNLKTGYVQDMRVHPEDKVELAYLEKKPMEYLYEDPYGFVFMDKETFDQETIPEGLCGDLMWYIKDNSDVTVVYHDGKPLSVELPASVQLEVSECDPAIKGSTAKDQYKQAIVQTGLKVMVPPFIEKGEIIDVSTADGSYLGRAK
jgi:elongation factor P